MANNKPVQIFGKNKCFDTKKAMRYFKERNIKIQFVDLNQKNFSQGELISVIKAVGNIDRLANVKSDNYHLFIHLLEDAKLQKMLDDPTLVKTPVVRFSPIATVGVDKDAVKIWKEIIKSL